MRTLARRIGVIIIAAAIVELIVLLWQIRPPLPGLSTSVTTRQTQQVFGFLAWLGIMILAFELLDRTARLTRRGPAIAPLSLPHLHPTEQHRPRPFEHGGGYSRVAFPLIPKSARTSAGDTARNAATREPNRPETKTIEPMTEVHLLPTNSISSVAPNALHHPMISLLGPVRITGVNKSGRRLRGATKELLCYLALRPHGAHRDQITDALWPHLPAERAKNELWRASTDARKHLGDTVLLRDGETYQLNHREVAIDIDRLEQLQRDAAQTHEPNRRVALLDDAMALFRGEALAGTDFLWADADRRRLHAAQLSLFEEAAQAWLEAGDPAGALKTIERGIASEPSNERLARLAMRAEAGLGLRTAIIDRYEQLSHQLGDQLGLRPDHETRSLYRELLGQDAAM